MTTRHTIEIEAISLIFLAGLLSSFLVWQNNKNLHKWFYSSLPFEASNKTQTVVVPVVSPKIETASQISPDGTKVLTMKKTHNSDSTFVYVFTTSDASGVNEREIYTTKLTEQESLNVPFNSWSPDNKYVFIQKNGSNALVFKATGEEIAPNQTYFDVADTFTKKGKKDVLSEVTGWADPVLLIVNAQTPESAKTISYWFELPSTAIIPLASQF